MLERAKKYILMFRWCKEIKESHFGAGVGGILAIFLFKIEPALVGVDEWIWIIVGDLPSAHIATDTVSDPVSALEGYIFEMRRWVNAAKSGASTSNLIPVNVPPTKEYADMLESRLNILEETFIPLFSESED